MATSAKFNFGDVVLVPFPFTDQSGTKKRPAVVVSSSGYSAQRRKGSGAKGQHKGSGLAFCQHHRPGSLGVSVAAASLDHPISSPLHY